MANELLSDEVLDGVAGGYDFETADDSRFLNVLLAGRAGQCDRWGEWKAASHTAEISQAWASVGVEFKHNGHKDNKYFINGNEVTREDAWAHAQQVVGRTLERTDWDW